MGLYLIYRAFMDLQLVYKGCLGFSLAIEASSPFARLPWTFGSSTRPPWPVGLYRQESMVLKLDDISTCLESLDGLLPLLFALQG